MSLPADVLVTALDAKGRLRAAGGVEVALAGALLIGDLLGGRSLRDLTGLDDHAVESVGNRTRGVVAIVASQAIAGGMIREDQQRVLGIFPRSRYVVVDIRARDALVQRLQEALTPGAEPDRVDAAFALVCSVSGVARQWVEAPRDTESRARVASHVNGLCEITGESVTTIVRAMRTLYRRRDAAGADASPFLLLPIDGTEDYGDLGPETSADSMPGDGSTNGGGSDSGSSDSGGSDGGGGGGGGD